LDSLGRARGSIILNEENFDPFDSSLMQKSTLWQAVLSVIEVCDSVFSGKQLLKMLQKLK